MDKELMRISTKGQLTIPISIRKKLNIKDGDYLHIIVEGEEIRLKKVKTARPLSSDDPMWELVGAGESGYKDVSLKHDQHLAEGEIKRWKK